MKTAFDESAVDNSEANKLQTAFFMHCYKFLEEKFVRAEDAYELSVRFSGYLFRKALYDSTRQIANETIFEEIIDRLRTGNSNNNKQ